MPVDSIRQSSFQFSRLSSLASRAALKMRQKMYRVFEVLADPQEEWRVLDVGVTSEDRPDCNFFEKMYPYPGRITGAGVEDAAHLEQKFPGLKYVQIDGRTLPFEDKAFDLVVSFAVLEHAGRREDQRRFLNELCRVGKRVCVTTPNRWHPVDFHTVLPFLHWLPGALHRRLLASIGEKFFSKIENLNLLSKSDVLKLVPKNRSLKVRRFWFMGFVSNFLFYIE